MLHIKAWFPQRPSEKHLQHLLHVHPGITEPTGSLVSGALLPLCHPHLCHDLLILSPCFHVTLLSSLQVTLHWYIPLGVSPPPTYCFAEQLPALAPCYPRTPYLFLSSSPNCLLPEFPSHTLLPHSHLSVASGLCRLSTLEHLPSSSAWTQLCASISRRIYSSLQSVPSVYSVTGSLSASVPHAHHCIPAGQARTL